MTGNNPALPTPPDERVREKLRDLYEHYDRKINEAQSYTEASLLITERRAHERRIVDAYWL